MQSDIIKYTYIRYVEKAIILSLEHDVIRYINRIDRKEIVKLNWNSYPRQGDSIYQLSAKEQDFEKDYFDISGVCTFDEYLRCGFR